MKRHVLLLLTAALLAATCARAQTLARKGWAGSGIQIQPWYRQAVFYQIDPISFADSTADGFGDLPGITAHLDYVESLNVDAILLSPLALEAAYARTASGPPFEPIYGSLDDFDQLITAASGRHLRVLVDLRLDQARSPAEAATTARFWLARGVAGLHVVSAAPGNAPNAKAALSAADYAARLAEVRRAVAAAPGQRVLVLEPRQGLTAPPASRRHHHLEATSNPAPQTGELTLLADSLMPASLSAERITASLNATRLAVSAIRTDDPDHARSFDRYTALTQPACAGALARSLAMLLLSTPAAPVLYFGQELGMSTTAVRTGVPASGSPRTVEPGDAGEPTPMQWDPSLTAPDGFTTGTPWIALADSTATANATSEDADAGSLLNWYRKLDRLRHTQASLREGGLVLIETAVPGVIGYVRLGAKVGGVTSSPVVVLVNLSGKVCVVSLTEPLRRAGLSASATEHIRSLARSDEAADTPGQPAATSSARITLAPFASYAGELTTQRGLESVATPIRRSRRRGR